MSDLVSSDIKEAAQKIREGASELRTAAVEQGKDALEAFSDSTEKVIKANPYRSVLIAFGVGAVAGYMFSKR